MPALLPILAIGALALAAFALARQADAAEQPNPRKKDLALDAIRQVLNSTNVGELRAVARLADEAGLRDEAAVLRARAEFLEKQSQVQPAATAPAKKSAKADPAREPRPDRRIRQDRKLTAGQAEDLVKLANAEEAPNTLNSIAAELERGGWGTLADAVRKRAQRAMSEEEKARLRANLEWTHANELRKEGMGEEAQTRAKAQAQFEAEQIARQREDLARTAAAKPAAPAKKPEPTPARKPEPTPARKPEPTPTKKPEPTPTKKPEPTPTKKPEPTPTKQPEKIEGPKPGPEHPSVPDAKEAQREKAARTAYNKGMESKDAKEVSAIAAMLSDFPKLAEDLRARAASLQPAAPAKPKPAEAEKTPAPATAPAPAKSPAPPAPKTDKPPRDYSDLPAAPTAKEAEERRKKAAQIVEQSRTTTDPDRLLELADQVRRLGSDYHAIADEIEAKVRELLVKAKKPAPAPGVPSSPRSDDLVRVAELEDGPNDLAAQARAAHEAAKKSGNIKKVREALALAKKANLADAVKNLENAAAYWTEKATDLRDRALKSSDAKQIAEIAEMLRKAGFDELAEQSEKRLAALKTPAKTKTGEGESERVFRPLGLPPETWQQFLQALLTAPWENVDERGRLGAFRYSVRRLASVPGLGLVGETRRDSAGKWQGAWQTPYSAAAFLASRELQVNTLATDLAYLRDWILRTYGTILGQPSQVDGRPISLSGLLAVAQIAGPQGLSGWLFDGTQREKFASTTDAYRRANGLF